MSSAVPKHCGTHSPICSGVPLPTMPDTPSVVPNNASVMPASPQARLFRDDREEEAVLSANALATNSHE